MKHTLGHDSIPAEDPAQADAVCKLRDRMLADEINDHVEFLRGVSNAAPGEGRKGRKKPEAQSCHVPSREFTLELAFCVNAYVTWRLFW